MTFYLPKILELRKFQNQVIIMSFSSWISIKHSHWLSHPMQWCIELSLQCLLFNLNLVFRKKIAINPICIQRYWFQKFALHFQIKQNYQGKSAQKRTASTLTNWNKIIFLWNILSSFYRLSLNPIRCVRRGWFYFKAQKKSEQIDKSIDVWIIWKQHHSIYESRKWCNKSLYHGNVRRIPNTLTLSLLVPHKKMNYY